VTRPTCHDCHQPIPNGQAHIRSACFVQVAYCASCWRIWERIARIVRAVHHGVAA
jgi:hypothetical protein